MCGPAPDSMVKCSFRLHRFSHCARNTRHAVDACSCKSCASPRRIPSLSVAWANYSPRCWRAAWADARTGRRTGRAEHCGRAAAAAEAAGPASAGQECISQGSRAIHSVTKGLGRTGECWHCAPTWRDDAGWHEGNGRGRSGRRTTHLVDHWPGQWEVVQLAKLWKRQRAAHQAIVLRCTGG